MIALPLTGELLRAARVRASQLPVYANSHRRRAANEVGCIGEVAFEHVLHERRIPFARISSTQQDLTIFGASVDVKTKDRTVPPQPHYECSVPIYNHEHQRPQLYVFISLQRDKDLPLDRIERFQTAHILGFATLKQVDAGRVWRQGEIDEDNGTEFWTDCLNLRVDELRPIEELLHRAEQRAWLSRV